MNATIIEKKAAIISLCKKFHVARLEVFGSVVKSSFDPETSDLDFLVEFTEEGVTHYADYYFGLLEELHRLFSRPIDLVVISAVKNPYFKQRIDEERKLLYAA